MLVENEMAAWESLWALRLRTLRLHRGLSLSEMSEAIEVSEDELWAYEAGDSQIAAASLWKICQTLEIAIDEMFGDQESPCLAGALRRLLH